MLKHVIIPRFWTILGAAGSIVCIMASRRKPGQALIHLFASAILLITVAGCTILAGDPSQEILGRWQRVGQATVGDPLGSLASEYVEFRENGQLVSLLYDAGPDRFWTTRTNGYSFPERGRIRIEGHCWRSWERFDCTGEYSYALSGDHLRISEDGNADGQVEFRRSAALEPGPPPTLVPPGPSPTPAG
jgi:hypothetical protein